MRYSSLLSALIATTLFFALPAAAQDNRPKWEGHVEAEGKWGTERSLGEIGLFLPVWQNNKTLIFGDVRGRFDDNASSEGNFGIGLRHQINDQWALGSYAFYDRRHTKANNNFDQVTLGVEALSENLEFRINGYIPESGEKTVSAGTTTTTPSATGGNLQFITSTTGGVVERALPGLDIEAGYQFDIPGNWDFWAYGGGFHFDANGYDNVTGPRGRVEMSYNNVPYLGDGSRFTLGFESQTDNVRGDQSWGIARIRIPFNYNGAKDTSQPSALDKRMTTRIVRDIDIVAGEAKTPATTTTEDASVTLANGQTYTNYTLLDDSDSLNWNVDDAGAGALVILDGVIDDIGNVRTLDNQAIIGGGQNVTLTGDTSGRTANVTLPGTRPSISITTPGNFGFDLKDNVLFENIDIAGGGQRGIEILNGNNQIVRNATISNTSNDNITIYGSDNVTIDNVTLNNPGGSAEEGIQVQDGVDNLTVSNSTINNANIGFIFVDGDNYNNITFTNITVDSSGDVIEAQDNTTVDQISGDITVNTGGTGCLESGTGQLTNSSLTINGAPCPPP